jgi:hypothetical protein
MILSFSSKCGLVTITGVAMLAGCANGGSVLRQPFDFAQGDKAWADTLTPGGAGALGRAAKAVAKSWMSPDARAHDLLYVSDSSTYDVYAYSYPKLRPVGTLTDQNNPAGLCTDSKGNVFVTQLYGHQIVEYRHGGTTPVRTLSDPGYEPGACSVNPSTGDLAVANVVSDEFTQGNLVVYSKGEGRIATYSPPGGASGGWFSVNDAGYAPGYPGGNLYFAGTCNGAFCAGVVPNGSSTAENVTLNARPQSPGTVQSDGVYITFADQTDGTIYAYTFSGTNGTEVHSTTLSGSSDVDGSWILWIAYKKHKNITVRVAAPQQNSGDVLLYGYWEGGYPRTLTGATQPFGATYSGIGHSTF